MHRDQSSEREKLPRLQLARQAFDLSVGQKVSEREAAALQVVDGPRPRCAELDALDGCHVLPLMVSPGPGA